MGKLGARHVCRGEFIHSGAVDGCRWRIFLEVVSSFVLSIVVGKPDKEGGSGRTVALAKAVGCGGENLVEWHVRDMGCGGGWLRREMIVVLD